MLKTHNQLLLVTATRLGRAKARPKARRYAPKPPAMEKEYGK